MSIEDVLDILKSRYPDKMLLDNFDDFNRGKLAGHIEIILEIESIIKKDDDDDDSK